MSATQAVLVVVLAIAAWAAYTYNFMVHARNKVREAAGGIEVQLKLRHDLVPGLIEVVRGYAAHERDAIRLTAASRARAIAARRPLERALAENELARSLTELVALIEQYPALLATEEFAALARQLRATEDEIQAARELYNANVEFYNSRAQGIPVMVVAGFMRPSSFPYAVIDAVDLSPIELRVREFAA